MNRKAIEAKLKDELSADDFETLKRSIAEETFKIEGEISALDSERSTMEDLMQQTRAQIVDLVATWNGSNVNQRQELARALFPEGLAFSEESLFFEPCNSSLMQLVTEFVNGMSPVGAGDGI